MFNTSTLKFKNLMLSKENKKIRYENKDLRSENEELRYQISKIVPLLQDSIKDLMNLQDINKLGLEETDKNQHRNVIINRLIGLFIDKENELTDTLNGSC